MNGNEVSLINRLENYRLEYRITQAQLADLLGVTVLTVNRWLNGHFRPNKIQAYHIEKLLSRKKSKR